MPVIKVIIRGTEHPIRYGKAKTVSIQEKISWHLIFVLCAPEIPYWTALLQECYTDRVVELMTTTQIL